MQSWVVLYAHVRPCLRKRRGGKTELEARASSGLRTWSRLWQTYTQTERCTRRMPPHAAPRPPPRRTTTLGEHRCTVGTLPKNFELFLFNRLTFIRYCHIYHLRVFVADDSRFAGLNLLLLQVQYCLHASFLQTQPQFPILPLPHCLIFPIVTFSKTVKLLAEAHVTIQDFKFLGVLQTKTCH